MSLEPVARRVNQTTFALGLPLASLLIAQAAHAQASTPGASGKVIEEVVVTAQRVEQNLQDVPVAVSVFNEEVLRTNRMNAMVDIAQRTPSFTATEVNPGEPNLAIRGIGTEGITSNAGGDASVVMFIDGVYIGRGGAATLDIFDVERVEVLRGPQGTLFGKNVVGGAISLVTRKPSMDEDFAEVGATFGDYDRMELLGRFNHAFSDAVAVSAAVSSRQRDGYTLNETTGNHVDDEDSTSGRIAVRYAPGDALDAVLSMDLVRQDQKGQPRDNVCDYSFQGGIHCVGVNPDERIVNAVRDGYLSRDVMGLTANIDYRTAWGTFTSVTAYRNADYSHADGFFSNPINPPAQIESYNENIEETDQFSQEFRLSFSALEEKLRAVTGIYFLHENIERNEMLTQDFPAPAVTGKVSFPQDVDSTSFAIFGQADYDLTARLTLTLGARLTWEKKDADLAGIQLTGPGLGPPLSAEYAVTADENWDAFTPKAAVSYRINDDAMVYGSAARGFKSGGYQGTAGTGASAAVAYDPEYAWSYEIGTKTEWLADSLRLNVAAFFTDYEDLQVSQLVPLCCVVIGNAATAEIKGVEVELLYRPVIGLDVNASYSWLDAEFKDFAGGVTADNSGNTLPRAPKSKWNVGTQYEWSVGDLGTLAARVDWTHQARIYFEASNTPLEVQESYSVVDGRLALRASDDSWEVALWGKNLGDELIKTHIVAFAPYRQQLNTYQPPRTYGISVLFRR
ncbi:MAG: TonB-dependent receptor [Gammaproteobacteria bacterium]|nr:TonB-dependent receptor [Gammaproteobacteria bacterium]